jgi:hypothetical protein
MFNLRSFVIAGAIAVAGFAGIGSSANAATYTLTNVGLSDGGLLNGSFSFNVYGGYLSYDLVSSDGSLPPESYNDAPGSVAPSASPFGAPTVLDFFAVGTVYTQELQLTFTGNVLAGLGILVGGLEGPSFECDESYSCYIPSGGLIRYVDANYGGGTVSATPLPAAIALFSGGLGLIGMIAKRKRRSQGGSRLGLSAA